MRPAGARSELSGLERWNAGDRAICARLVTPSTEPTSVTSILIDSRTRAREAPPASAPSTPLPLGRGARAGTWITPP